MKFGEERPRAQMVNLPCPPSPNQTLKVARGHVYRTKESKAYRELVWKECLSQKIRKMEGPLFMKVYWHPKNVRSDCDNALKHLNDSLQGVLFENDREISAVWIRRFKDRTGRVTVWVERDTEDV